jgi:hypothetical protein
MAKNDFDELMSVGVDISKDVFHLIGFDKEGQLVLGKKIKRMALIVAFEEFPHYHGHESFLKRAFYQLDATVRQNYLR